MKKTGNRQPANLQPSYPATGNRLIVLLQYKCATLPFGRDTEQQKPITIFSRVHNITHFANYCIAVLKAEG